MAKFTVTTSTPLEYAVRHAIFSEIERVRDELLEEFVAKFQDRMRAVIARTSIHLQRNLRTLDEKVDLQITVTLDTGPEAPKVGRP